MRAVSFYYRRAYKRAVLLKISCSCNRYRFYKKGIAIQLASNQHRHKMDNRYQKDNRYKKDNRYHKNNPILTKTILQKCIVVVSQEERECKSQMSVNLAYLCFTSRPLLSFLSLHFLCRQLANSYGHHGV